MQRIHSLARRPAAALYRVSLNGFGEQIGTADELANFGHRIGEAFNRVRRLFDDTTAEQFLDDVSAGLTCELVTAPDGGSDA